MNFCTVYLTKGPMTGVGHNFSGTWLLVYYYFKCPLGSAKNAVRLSSNNKEQYSIKRRYCIHYEWTVRHSSAKVKSRLAVSHNVNPQR